MRLGFGAKVVRSRMRELSAQGRRAAFRRTVEIAQLALAIWYQLVPVDTGDLKSTGRVEVDPRAMTAMLIAGGLAKSGKMVDYAAIVEDDQPAMKPAIRLALSKSRNRSFSMTRAPRFAELARAA